MKKIIINIVKVIIIILMLLIAYYIYLSNNFIDYVKAEKNIGVSAFKRDFQERYSDEWSHSIESTEFNDAMFFETVKLEPNTPYRLTCMVKVENVVPFEENENIGAQISIEASTEASIAIQGTSGWQEIELIFDSKERTEVNIGFRLGGYAGDATGKVWFTDFKIEEGTKDLDNVWNFGYFIFEETKVNIDNEIINIQMTEEDLSDIDDIIERFEESMEILTEKQMDVEYKTYNIKEPLSSLSYDQEFGYYVSEKDIKEQIDKIVEENEFDHVFVIIRLGNEMYVDDIEIKDWIGLGYMDYAGIGFSNIRLPNDSKSYIYKYNSRINTFPEEVLVHEFLHSLERAAIENGYEIPALHDYELYGYEHEALIGQKEWYRDYLNKEVLTTEGTYIGLPEVVYSLKPVNSKNFENSYEMKNIFGEPQNFIDKITEFFKI